MALPGREEARALIMAEFEDYIYCCTHLSLTEEDRMTSLEMIKNFAASAKKSFLPCRRYECRTSIRFH